jgi:hypothetical protein
LRYRGKRDISIRKPEILSRIICLCGNRGRKASVMEGEKAIGKYDNVEDIIYES